MNNLFKKALGIAKSYTLSDGFSVSLQSEGTAFLVSGSYLWLQFEVDRHVEELTVGTNQCDGICFEILADEMAAFNNLETELLPVYHALIKEVNS